MGRLATWETAAVTFSPCACPERGDSLERVGQGRAAVPVVGSGRIPLEDIVSGVGDFVDLFFMVKAVAAFDRWADGTPG